MKLLFLLLLLTTSITFAQTTASDILEHKQKKERDINQRNGIVHEGKDCVIAATENRKTFHLYKLDKKSLTIQKEITLPRTNKYFNLWKFYSFGEKLFLVIKEEANITVRDITKRLRTYPKFYFQEIDYKSHQAIGTPQLVSVKDEPEIRFSHDSTSVYVVTFDEGERFINVKNTQGVQINVYNLDFSLKWQYKFDFPYTEHLLTYDGHIMNKNGDMYIYCQKRVDQKDRYSPHIFKITHTGEVTEIPIRIKQNHRIKDTRLFLSGKELVYMGMSYIYNSKDRKFNLIQGVFHCKINADDEVEERKVLLLPHDLVKKSTKQTDDVRVIYSDLTQSTTNAYTLLLFLYGTKPSKSGEQTLFYTKAISFNTDEKILWHKMLPYTINSTYLVESSSSKVEKSKGYCFTNTLFYRHSGVYDHVKNKMITSYSGYNGESFSVLNSIFVNKKDGKVSQRILNTNKKMPYIYSTDNVFYEGRNTVYVFGGNRKELRLFRIPFVTTE